jgi:hypothetical protein
MLVVVSDYYVLCEIAFFVLLKNKAFLLCCAEVVLSRNGLPEIPVAVKSRVT